MDCVNETVLSRLLSAWSHDILITQKAGWHAWPQGENNKGNQIAHGHCPSPCLVQSWSRGAPGNFSAITERGLLTCVVVEQNQEEDGSWNVDERVSSIYPDHKVGILEEEVLNAKLPENMESFFEVYEFESVFSGYMYSALNECYCCYCAADLVDLVRVNISYKEGQV
jgi:hypothetical protein